LQEYHLSHFSEFFTANKKSPSFNDGLYLLLKPEPHYNSD